MKQKLKTAGWRIGAAWLIGLITGILIHKYALIEFYTFKVISK